MKVSTCHLHGDAGIARVCSHIRDAIKTHAMVPAWSSYPWSKALHAYVVLRFCTSCVERLELPVPARTLGEHEVELEDLGTEAICEACFAAAASAP